MNRAAVVEAARSFLDTPYQWGGGHAGPSWGLDCSGLVIQAMRKAGEKLPPGISPTSTEWWAHLPHVPRAQLGTLAFYGRPGHATHVVMVTSDAEPWPIIGANGGDRDVLTPEIAKARGAKVDERPSYTFRKDFLGFAELAPGGNSPTKQGNSGGGILAALAALAFAWWL